tara:strand:+ start:1130 stop:1516 length:387 start_codon:yes stop_codon:yes gene_type:complete
MFKSIFYLINTIFAIFYLFPGSILGYLLYKNFNKQPQLTDDFNFLLFNFSSNHVFAFLILSFLGFLLFYEKKKKIILTYFFSISIFYELLHIYIPNRSFQISDLYGNILGILMSLILFIFFSYVKKKF